MAGFVVRDNSLSVAEAAASGNGVTTPYEAPVPAARPRGGRLKRVCIPDEDQIRLARKQPIHRTLFSFDLPAIYTTDYVPTARLPLQTIPPVLAWPTIFYLAILRGNRLAAFTRSRCDRNQLFYRSFSVTLEDTRATLRCSLRWLFVPPAAPLLIQSRGKLKVTANSIFDEEDISFEGGDSIRGTGDSHSRWTKQRA